MNGVLPIYIGVDFPYRSVVKKSRQSQGPKAKGHHNNQLAKYLGPKELPGTSDADAAIVIVAAD